MATNNYKLVTTSSLQSGSTTVYLASANISSSIIKSLYISNKSTGSVSCDVIINRSGSAVNYYLIASGSIPVQTTFQPISDTLTLQSNDSIKIGTAFSGSIDTILSTLEIS